MYKLPGLVKATYIEWGWGEVHQGGAIQVEHLQLDGVVQASDGTHLFAAHHQAGQLQAMVNHQLLQVRGLHQCLGERLGARQRQPLQRIALPHKQTTRNKQ